MSEKIKRIFGIDLGTTYSSIAYVDDYGKPVIVPNAEGNNITPSVVFFDGNDIVVGDAAKENAKLYPDDVVSCVKRAMGEAGFIVEHNSKTYRAEEISSYIIKKVVQDAEINLGETIHDVVITCPAYFGINEREATKIAGEIAGYNVRQIINEPTAAAIAYGFTEASDNKIVLVYDLGGGTFDITMIDIKPDAIEVVCTGGDHNLGGKDWDDRIVACLANEFQAQTNSAVDILEDPDTCQDLQLSAEKAKIILSMKKKAPIVISHGGDKVKVEFEREKFEELTESLVERTVAFTRAMLEEAAKKGYDRFDEIIFVGGSTRMPMIAARIFNEFSARPKIFDPDGAVAKGAAIYGWKLALNDGLINRIVEKTVRKTGKSADMIVKETNGELDDIVAKTSDVIIGEAVREIANETGIHASSVKRSMLKVSDVASKSFGIVIKNIGKEEEIFNLILRNTAVPVEVNRIFFTAADNQKQVLINIMETETSSEVVPLDSIINIASASIGKAILNLPPDIPKDSPIEINFKLNKEGRLIITAEEVNEGKKVKVTIDTQAVIQGKDLEEARKRCQDIIVH